MGRKSEIGNVTVSSSSVVDSLKKYKKEYQRKKCKKGKENQPLSINVREEAKARKQAPKNRDAFDFAKFSAELQEESKQKSMDNSVLKQKSNIKYPKMSDYHAYKPKLAQQVKPRKIIPKANLISLDDFPSGSEEESDDGVGKPMKLSVD